MGQDPDSVTRAVAEHNKQGNETPKFLARGQKKVRVPEIQKYQGEFKNT